MKQRSKGILFLWLVIAVVAAGGTFLIAEHLGVGTAPGARPEPAVTVQPNADAQPDVSMQQDNPTSDDASGVPADAVPMQTFSSDGYSFNVPASWNVERTASDTIAVHPDAASPDATCKIEVSAFPFAAGTDIAGWIGAHIGADPSVSVAEQSSEDVSVSGGTGVKWIGMIDGIPTTLVYLFSADRAYEIAPSVIGEGASGDSQCDDMLETFLGAITI